MARILVVEDDEPLSRLLREVLEAEGHAVVAVATGRLAIAQLQLEKFDALVTDLVVPDQDGLEVILAARRLMLPPPILAISGATANAELYLTIARKLGACDTLEKPFTPTELIDRVNRLLFPGS